MILSSLTLLTQSITNQSKSSLGINTTPVLNVEQGMLKVCYQTEHGQSMLDARLKMLATIGK